MVMICNIPDDVIESVKIGTWPGSFIVVNMVLNSIPLDNIKTEICNIPSDGIIYKQTVLGIIDKYKDYMSESGK